MNQRYVVFLVSYAHIDSEWLWTLSETVELCRTTYEKVIDLMMRYKSLSFLSGGILCYKLLENRYPDVVEKVVDLVKKGRWFFIPSYLEFDAYMSSGESIIRHILYAYKFLEKLGVKPRSIVLPDSFGFPNTLPKLLKGLGIKYFATAKLSWNDTNELPYHVFRWKGDDGSEVIAYLLPGSYSDYLVDVKRVLWNLYTQMRKQRIPLLLQIHGRGDHGGGPDEEEIVNVEMMVKKCSPLITLTYSSHEEFFDYVEKFFKEMLPVIDDELYLEFHRGVYTTGFLVKKLNRFNEVLVTEVEKLFTLLKALYNMDYPKELLSRLWEPILLNQGHDTLPATVTSDVYKDVVLRGFKVFKELIEMLREGLKFIACREGGEYTVFNPNSWRTSTYVTVKGGDFKGWGQKIGDNTYVVFLKDLPPLGVKVLSTLGSRPNDIAKIYKGEKHYILENKYLRVVVSKDSGWITSIYDKNVGREVLRYPARLVLLWDYPITLRGKAVFAGVFDAWETFYLDTVNKYLRKDLKAYRHEVVAEGPMYVSIAFHYKYRQTLFKESYVKMVIGLYADKPFVEVKFEVFWNTLNRFLKFVIPLNIDSEEAVFEVPYGIVRRRDSCRSRNPVDKARYEVPGQRWVDVSDGSFGVAVINDSRYGFSWCNGVLGVSLLRSPLQPMKKFILKSIESYPSIQRNFLDVKLLTMGKMKRVSLWLGMLIGVTVLKLLNIAKILPVDRGYHTLTIWVYPHKGDYVEGSVPIIASELNTKYVVVKGCGDSLNKDVSLLSVEPSDKVLVTAMKICENVDDCIALRLQNISPTTVKASIKLGFSVEKVFKAMHTEEPISELPLENGDTVHIDLHPYAVETLLLKLQGSYKTVNSI